MKSSTVALLAYGGVANALTLPTYMGTPVDPNLLPDHFPQKRQLVSSLVGGALNTPGFGKVAASAGDAPARQELAPRIPGAKTVKIRYGPYKIPDVSTKNRASGHTGTIYNLPDPDVPVPCKDCTLVGFNAGLEFPNGENANINKGFWLHHYVHFVVGPGRSDPTCAGRMSLPHLIIGSSPGSSERFFSSGNERTKVSVLELGPNYRNVGYYLRNTDKMALIVDLMNETPKPATVYLTATYDYLPGQPAGYSDLRPVWFDAAQCMTSEVKPPQQTGQFTISAAPWTANFEGEVAGYAGHLHDGGVSIDLEVNGKSLCHSVAGYGEKPEFIGTSAHAHGGSGDGAAHAEAAPMKHISSMTLCTQATYKIPGIKLKKGDKWTLKGYYDYDKYAGSKHGAGGKQDDIMAIAIMYVKQPMPARGSVAASAAPAAAASAGTGGGRAKAQNGLLSRLAGLLS